ncbi:MAG TPA: glycoside hydrolase domain-containing protein [Gemmatimonadaceae bacterium]|nr:glycoside hydrolase domain-containing protein [Gemmatimonadaceae bacterium]
MIPTRWSTPRLLALLAALLLATACAGVDAVLGPPADRISHPGFDTSIYPGDAAMRTWRETSPYEWSGYYLPAPCHRDETWSGRRASLEAMGWGLAVLYVGQQTWDNVSTSRLRDMSARLSVARAESATGAVRCSRTLLSAAQGTAEADDAIVRTEAEGFPRGTVIYLDLEYMTSVSPTMREYFDAWLARVLADGRFRPGVYAHRSNASELYALARMEFLSAGRPDEPAFWVAGGSGFSLDRRPEDVGHDFAAIWQGRLDVYETWGGVELRIDVNVSRWLSPSSPGT